MAVDPTLLEPTELIYNWILTEFSRDKASLVPSYSHLDDLLALIDEGTGHLLCVGQPDVELNGRGAEEPVAVTYRDVQGDWLGRRTRGCFECDVTVASVQ